MPGGCERTSSDGRKMFAGSGSPPPANLRRNAMPAQVLTQHNDNARTGANLAESILTPDAVAAPGRFGKLFERQVEGQVYAQALYVPNVAFPQGQRNALYVATMRNNVYAFDADDPQASAPLWQKNLGPFGRCPTTPTTTTSGAPTTGTSPTRSGSSARR